MTATFSLSFAALSIDCADPSTDGQAGNAPCFNPALRTAAP